MASELAVEEVTVPVADDEFVTASIKIRGKTYKFRELATEDYDKLLILAAGPDDLVDRTLLLKLMVAESMTEPDITAEELSKLPYPVTRRLGNLVNRMHYLDPDEEDEEEEEEVAPKRRRRS